jgi:hypothetical protein
MSVVPESMAARLAVPGTISPFVSIPSIETDQNPSLSTGFQLMSPVNLELSMQPMHIWPPPMLPSASLVRSEARTRKREK